jgi:hypothetical protein
MNATRLRGFDSGLCTKSEDIALKLRHARKKMKRDFAGGAGRIDMFGQRVEVCASIFDLIYKVDQVAKVAAETIKPPYYEHAARF